MAHRRREALLSTEAESATTEVNQMKSGHEGGSVLRMRRHARLAVPGHTQLLRQDLCLLSCQSSSLPCPVRPLLNTPGANGLEYIPAGSGPSVTGEESECVQTASSGLHSLVPLRLCLLQNLEFALWLGRGSASPGGPPESRPLLQLGS